MVVVEPADAEILLDGKVVGIGTWGSVLEEGEELTLVVRREGYEEDVVFVPQKGQRTARIARKLKALPAPGAADGRHADRCHDRDGSGPVNRRGARDTGRRADTGRGVDCRRADAGRDRTRSQGPERSRPTASIPPSRTTRSSSGQPGSSRGRCRDSRSSAVSGATKPVAAAWPRGADIAGRAGCRARRQLRAAAPARGREARAAAGRLLRMDAARAGARRRREGERQGVRHPPRRRVAGALLQPRAGDRSAGLVGGNRPPRRITRHRGASLPWRWPPSIPSTWACSPNRGTSACSCRTRRRRGWEPPTRAGCSTRCRMPSSWPAHPPGARTRRRSPCSAIAGPRC